MGYEETLKEFEGQVEAGRYTLTVNASEYLVSENLLEAIDEIVEERYTGSYSDNILVEDDDLFYMGSKGWVSIIVTACSSMTDEGDESITNEIYTRLEKIVAGLDKNRKK
jgi:hypothetical protein